MVDSVLQAPVASNGPDLGCSGYLNFSVPGLTRTYAYLFAFSVEDSAGNVSAWESMSVIAQ
jgi:chitodextrinase